MSLNQKNSKCAGTYPVSSYTKKNGTEVSAHMRTCGAKHAGSKHPHLDPIADKMTDGTIDVLNNGDSVLYGGISADAQEAAMRNVIFQYYKFIQLFANSEISTKLFECLKFYALSLDFKNMKEINKENAYIKLWQIPDVELLENIRKFSDIEDLNEDTDVVIPQFGESFHKKFMESPEFKRVIEQNKEAIERGEFRNRILPISFSESTDLRLTVGHGALYDLRFNEDGVLCGTFWDGTNYEKKLHGVKQAINELEKYRNYEHYAKLVKTTFNTIIINNAYKQQQNGKLMNYVIVMPIVDFSWQK